MYKIKLCGEKKAVYIVWSNLVGYGLADIIKESGNEEAFELICSISTKNDAVPNQDYEAHVWNGKVIDLNQFDFEKAQKGSYAGQYIDNDLGELSGLFNVEIYVLGIEENPWWIDAECDPEYPYYEFKNGKEAVYATYDTEKALNTGFVEPEELGIEEEEY